MAQYAFDAAWTKVLNYAEESWLKYTIPLSVFIIVNEYITTGSLFIFRLPSGYIRAIEHTLVYVAVLINLECTVTSGLFLFVYVVSSKMSRVQRKE